MERTLKKLARKLSQMVYYKKLSAAICDKGIAAIYIYPSTTLPRDALVEISNAFKEQGLAPFFEEAGGALVIKWLPIKTDVVKCNSIETKQTNLPEEILKENNLECIKFFKKLLQKNTPSILVFLLNNCPSCSELQSWIWEGQMDIKDETEAALLQEGIENLYEIQVSECPSFGSFFKLTKYPSGVLFYKGKVLDKCEGTEECKRKIKVWALKISRDNRYSNLK